MFSRLGLLVFTVLIGLSNGLGLYAQGEQEIAVPKIFLFDDPEKVVLVTIKPTQRERYHFSVKKKDDGKADQEEDTKTTFSLPYSSVELLQAAIEKHTNYFAGKDDADGNQNEIKKVWDLIHFAETIGNNILDGDGPIAGKLSIQDTAYKVYWVERNYTYRSFFRKSLKKSLKSEWKRNQNRDTLLTELDSLGSKLSPNLKVVLTEDLESGQSRGRLQRELGTLSLTLGDTLPENSLDNQTQNASLREWKNLGLKLDTTFVFDEKTDWSAMKYWQKYRKQLKLISGYKNKKHYQWQVYLEKREKEFDARLKQNTDVCDDLLERVLIIEREIFERREKIKKEQASLAKEKKKLDALNLRIKATEQDRDSVINLWKSKAPNYYYYPIKSQSFINDTLVIFFDSQILQTEEIQKQATDSISKLRTKVVDLSQKLNEVDVPLEEEMIDRIKNEQYLIGLYLSEQKSIEKNAIDHGFELDNQKNHILSFSKALNKIKTTLSELNEESKLLKPDFTTKERDANLEIKSWNDTIQQKQNEKKRLIRRINARGAKIKEELIPQNQQFSFVIKSVDIEFSQGYIENIKVMGDLISELKCSCFIKTDTLGQTSSKEKPTRIIRNITFHNPAPIGFSRKMDYGSLQYQALYSRDEDHAYALLLGDVIESYNFELYRKRRDYSPGDQYEPTKIEGGESATLHKTSTYKLFQGKVYTDFLGLNDQNPNGILQLNANKDINLLTQRYVFRNPFANSFYKVFYPGGIQFSFLNIGLMTSVQPSATISKVEKNLRDLDLSFKSINQGGQTEQIAYVSTLDLKRHEQASIGVKANVFMLDWPALKSTVSWNNYFYFGNVILRDTLNGFIQNDENRQIANTFQLGSEISIDILPEERYSLWMSYSWNTYLLSDNIAEQVADGPLFDITGRNENARKFRSINVLMRFTPKPDSPNQLFLNIQRYYQKDLWNTNFHQIQLGYSFYLLSNYRKPGN